MRLRSLTLTSFRAHGDTVLDFGPRLNILHGANGVGKTNVLEAIHYLCLAKSFLQSSDVHALRHGNAHFEIEGYFEGEQRAELRVKLVFVRGEGKRVFVNGVPLARLAELVGMLPVVVLSPTDIALTSGGPEERRRFLDATLSQASRVYLDDLMSYRRALRQRNALLQQVRRGSGLPAGTLDAWDEELIELGSRLIERRAAFLESFAVFLSEAHALLGAVGEEPALEYQTLGGAGELGDRDAIISAFRKALARERRRESALGRTLVGPHRDEIVLRLGEFEVRPYASQGQHRTVSLGMRLATFLFLRDRLDETPMLLLDDVFGALDDERAAVILSLLQSDALGQSILTSARLDTFEGLLPQDKTHYRLTELPVADTREISVTEPLVVSGAPD